MTTDETDGTDAGTAYRSRLRKLGTHVSPMELTATGAEVTRAAAGLAALPEVTRGSLAGWVAEHPGGAYTLGLVVGLSQEKLRNNLAAAFDTSSWAKVAREQPAALIEWFDTEFDLVALLETQRSRDYTFADVLVARGSSKTAAGQAASAGLLIEDAVEAIVRDLALPYKMRGRFVGRQGETGPADLAVPDFEHAKITVACKGFDSTGSKLTAAVTEVEAMAQVRFADQYVFGVVDGIGWNLRQGDFRRMYALLETGRIDGLYTLADLDVFRDDLRRAAQRVGLLP